MAGVVVSGGSGEAPERVFRQRLLGFLALLLLVLARSASAGVLVRERPDDGGNRGRDYLQTFGRGDNTNRWNGIRLNDSFAGLRHGVSRTRDRGNLFTSNKHHNHGNDRRGSTSTGVAYRRNYEEVLMKHYLNSLDDKSTLKAILRDKSVKTLPKDLSVNILPRNLSVRIFPKDLSVKTLPKNPSVKVFPIDPSAKTLDSYPTEHPAYGRGMIMVPVGLIISIVSSCLYVCGRVCECKREEEVRERTQVLLRLFVPAQRPPAAEDETETQDQDTEAPPTYSDALKSESPPAYSEVCAEET